MGPRMKVIWPLVSDKCPFDSAIEDMYHRTKSCSWLTIPVRACSALFRVCGALALGFHLVVYVLTT